MKQMYMLFFGLLVLILTGCSDHDWVDTDTDKPVKVTAQIAKSRVGFNEVDNITNAYWQEGDAITLFTSSQGNLDYVAGASAGSSSSKAFTPRSGYLKAIDGEQVLACYPASTIEDGKVSLPITTDWEDNDPMPFAYAVSSIEDSEVNLQFEHVFSFLKLTVTPSMLSDTTKAVRQLIVRTSSGAPLSIGEGSTFDYSTKEASIANGENTIQIATDTKVVRTSWEVYLPVLPQPADADITIALMSVEGDTLYSLTKKTPSTGLEKGNVYRVGTSISYDTSFLIDGPTFNTRIKQLANDAMAGRGVWDINNKIAKVMFVTENYASTEDCIDLSADNSPTPIYASFSKEDSLLTVFTQAKKIETSDASFMFSGLTSLRSLELGNFKVNEMTVNMGGMFYSCSSLTTLNLGDWETGNVTNMGSLFNSCSSLTTLGIANWNTGKVTDMESLFSGCSSLTTLDISLWNTVNVTSMHSMFNACSSLTTLNIGDWETGNVTSMHLMFSNCSSLSTLDIGGWETGKVNYMGSMFRNCSALTRLDISDWHTNSVTNMQDMFRECTSLISLDASNWKTDNVTDMKQMFSECSSLETLKTVQWNTAEVTDMHSMFYDCSSLQTLDIAHWNTGKVVDMGSMFNGCSSLTVLDLSDWQTENVYNMQRLFSDCSSLTELDASNWSFKEGVTISYLFDNCASISQACRITTKQESKEFLLSNTDNTRMTVSWFIWGDAASDGSSFDTVPKEDW